MSQLVITGNVAPMAQGAAQAPAPGRVWIDGDTVVEVTTGRRRVAGFSRATEVDVGDAYVLPGFVDMHNHLAYNALPLWTEPGRTEPWLHNKHWPDADTYTESVTEPAWVYAKACPEALLAYVQVRAMAGGAAAAQGWPTANRGYRTVMRNVDAEDVGTGRDDLVYTSVVTKTGEALTTAVRRMIAGSGFIYHCAEGRRGSRVLADYTDLDRADGLLPTLLAVHACAVDADRWARWAPADAGGVVWSPTSNLLLYAETTLVDDARARGVTVCLGSDWGPSGTKNLLGEMKVARIAADHLGYAVTDAQIVEMVTSNPGLLLERCWHRPVGRLVPGALADVTVVRGRGRGDAWRRVVAARERDVALVVVGGVARYGDSSLMTAASAPPSFTVTVGGRRRRVALPDPADPQRAWSWTAVLDTLRAVQEDPQQAIANAQARASAGPRFAPDAELELFLDMPDTRRTGRAGPPKNPATVTIPPVPTLEHDAAYFDLLEAAPIPGGVLAPLRARFGR
ncbi:MULTISPECIES: amidohydrolase family protein [unclassified Isoptericola]|uniref:amidohydrolase family protein n=1 Tax=Isoptericola sp. NPDC057191 TaxID=3346041 RepID=UPI003637B3D3